MASSARWVCLLVLAIGSVHCTAGSNGGGGGAGGAGNQTGGTNGGSGGSVSPGSGGATGSGGSPGSGGAVVPGSGGATVDAATDKAGSGGTGVDARMDRGTGGATVMGCDTTAGLVWKTGSKTHYTSYPVPGSVECIQFSGCQYQGLFAACPARKSKTWVMSHNIASVFPDRSNLNLHDLCLKSGNKTLVVTVYDECADSDCSGCCTQNKGSADELIDLEDATDGRFGVDDGRIQWADMGPTKGDGCNGN